jgi:hypothetical protein
VQSAKIKKVQTNNINFMRVLFVKEIILVVYLLRVFFE